MPHDIIRSILSSVTLTLGQILKMTFKGYQAYNDYYYDYSNDRVMICLDERGITVPKEILQQE